ncbi:MAG: hypothetical protein GC171_01300 [Terrimonas sp.]|nr:hypothetical protein [Terrimonas sp.]
MHTERDSNNGETVQAFQFGTQEVQICIPDTDKVKEQYYHRLQRNELTPFPYWAQVWPASIAICRFINAHTHFVYGKKVLELAGGLGLPSMLSAKYAERVIVSDYAFEAVFFQNKSIDRNQLKNISCVQLNWHTLPDHLDADLILLSDINYDPIEFETIYAVLLRFINQGSTIIISTPQRIQGRDFLELLMPLCSWQEEITVTHLDQQVAVTILVLEPAT